MIDQTRALYEQIHFIISRVRLRWQQNGMAEEHTNSEIKWYTKILDNLSRSVLKHDLSVLEFNKHAEDFELKFKNLKEILNVIEQNLLHAYGVGDTVEMQH